MFTMMMLMMMNTGETTVYVTES